METVVKQIAEAVFGKYKVVVSNDKFESAEAVSTSGSCYSDHDYIDGFVWSPKQGLIRVTQRVMTKCAAQNADGSWENSVGFSIADVPDGYNYLLVVRDQSYWDVNGRDEESHTATIYKLEGNEASKLKREEKLSFIERMMELLE